MVFSNMKVLLFSGETGETPYAWFASLPGWWVMCFKPGGSECIQRSICCWTNLIHDPFGKLTPDLFIPSESSRSEAYSLFFSPTALAMGSLPI